MKNLLTKRIIILISLAIVLSTMLITAVGVYLLEGLGVEIRGQEILPDLSVLSSCTIAYQEGDITKEIYEKIIDSAINDQSRTYMIYGERKEIILASEDIVNIKEEEQLDEYREEVFEGKNIYCELYVSNDDPVEMVGMPIVKEGEIKGAVFVLEEMVDIKSIKRQVVIALVIAILVIMPLVAGASYLVLKRIIKPVRNIVEVALSMIEGDFSIRADETLEGEIGFIGKTMNMLSVNLYKNISQLFIEKNRLQQVLNSLDEGMIAVDENKNITHFNYAFLHMFSLTSEMVKGKSLEVIDSVNGEIQELSQAIEGKYPIIKNIIHGEAILKISIAPIENEKKQVVGAVVIVKDITEVEKLENIRREYVANVSHELRSPLTAIRGLIEPLKDSIVTNEEDVKRYYDIIYRESLRLSRLVDDIMELSRLQTNDSVISKTNVNLNTIIEMVYERYRLFDEEIELIFERIDLPEVYSNYDRIEQILIILIDNAYKFTSKDGQIKIVTELRQENVLIKVVDTGQGISEEDIPFVFDRFYKSDKSRTKKGTGLGLSIAKEILSIMDEEIYVVSEFGKGSSFEFTVHINEVL